jgi:hypothetical protein
MPLIIRLLRLSADDGLQPAGTIHEEAGPDPEWRVAAERVTRGGRRERIVLTAWREPQSAAFAAVPEGILELFESPDDAFGDPLAVVAGDRVIVSRGYAPEGAEASVLAAARAGIAAEVAARRIGAGGIGRRVAGDRLEVLLVRIGHDAGSLSAEVTDLLVERVDLRYRVTAAHAGTPAHGGGPAFR